MEGGDKKDGLLLNFIPKYSIVPIYIYIVTYIECYFGGGFLIYYFNLKKHNISIPFDNNIPYLSIFVIFYLLFYIYIILGPLFISRINQYFLYRFVSSGIVGSFIGFLTFILHPTYAPMEKIVPTNFLDNIFLFVRSMDVYGSGVYCPSFHCFLSFLIFIAIASIPTIKKEVKIKFFTISILICLSTVFTRQHSVVDIFGGILLALISWNMTKNQNLLNKFIKLFDKMNFIK